MIFPKCLTPFETVPKWRESSCLQFLAGEMEEGGEEDPSIDRTLITTIYSMGKGEQFDN